MTGCGHEDCQRLTGYPSLCLHQAPAYSVGPSPVSPAPPYTITVHNVTPWTEARAEALMDRLDRIARLMESVEYHARTRR